MMRKENPFGNAVYIKAQQEPSSFSLYDPLPLFRKEFTLQQTPAKAQLLVQSPGFACYYINGKPVTKDLFISATSDYRKILWYDTYDVTALLQPGKNVLGVIAGNGFFNESFKSAWDFDVAPWRDAPQFLLCLKADEKEVVVSNGSWKADKESSPIIYSHLRSGEYFDARKYNESWKQAGFNDSAWQPAIENRTPPTGELRPVPCQPVREAKVIEPVAVTQTNRGYLVDFGINMSGYMEITLQAQRGTEIVFRYTEEVDQDLNPQYNGMDKPHFYSESPFQVNKLIASGGVDTFKPLFSYHGFRYVLIEGLEQAPDPASMRAYFTHQDVARTSEFACGNEVINYIYNAGIHSTYSNMFWCLTDCPTREKLGWANDAQASVRQTLLNFDMVPLYEKWFEDLKSSMKEDGSLPGIIPSPEWGYHCGPVCDCLLYELPYRIYVYTGNADMMIGAIPYFERYATFLEQKVLTNHEYWLADWKGYSNNKQVPKEFVRDFYLLKCFKVTHLAHRLAKTGCTQWEEKYQQYAARYMEQYLNPDGSCAVEASVAIAMLLEMGLYQNKEPLAKQLATILEQENCQYIGGMVGIQYIYDALSHIGRPDLVYRLLTESEPGFKTWYENGATSLWERWDGLNKESHNHHMYSSVMQWFFTSLLGLEPMEEAPGFAALELHPALLKELGFAKGKIKTAQGEIAAGWVYKKGEFCYTVTVPAGVRATFKGQTLKTGKNEFIIKGE